MDIDPNVIRFAHSRIRPVFTGCCRRIEDTLQDILTGKLRATDIPIISVLNITPVSSGLKDKMEVKPEFVSLNNRRLYLFKKLREMDPEGNCFLPGNTITVRVKPALEREKEKYTVDRCSLQAKLMKDISSLNVHEKIAVDGDSSRTLDEMYDEDDVDDGCNENADFSEIHATTTSTVFHRLSLLNEESAKATVDVTNHESIPILSNNVSAAIIASSPSRSQQQQQQRKLSTEPTTISKMTPLPQAILRTQVPIIKKLVDKGKTRPAMSEIDEICDKFQLNDQQRAELCRVVGMPLKY